MVFGGSDSKMLICQWFFNGFGGSDSKMLIFHSFVFPSYLRVLWRAGSGGGSWADFGTDPPYAPGDDSGILFIT